MSQAVANDRRQLTFASVDDALADVAQLRRGYDRLGTWSLPQICWHLGIIVERFLKPAAANAVATPEQAARKVAFVDAILNGTAPKVGEAAPSLVASADVGDEAIDLFDAQFRRLRDFPHPFTDMGSCGPVTIDEFRTCHLYHAAHHLSFLVPTMEDARG